MSADGRPESRPSGSAERPRGWVTWPPRRTAAARAALPPAASSWAGPVLVIGALVSIGVFGGVWVLAVVCALIVIVVLHELGHFLTARWAGMKVSEFYVGFGPRLWSVCRGETSYGVRAVLAGAYVRILGMNNLEKVDPAEEHRTYRSKPYWRRMSVAVAGSAVHFLLAVVLLWVLYSAVGFHGFDRPDATETPLWQVSRVVPDSPAEAMGLLPGDRISSVAGRGIENFGDLRGALADLAHRPATVTVVRDGETVRLEGVIGASPRDGASGFLGVGPELAPAARANVISGFTSAVRDFGLVVRASAEGIAGLFSLQGLDGLLGPLVDFERDEAVTGEAVGGDPNRVVSVVGVARIGGSLAQADVTALINFLAYLNVFFGVLNLFPLLPLDGGHVVIATYERLRSFGGRRYQADVAKMLPAAYVFVIVLVTVGLVALSRDIVDPFSLPG
ncbi:MAG: site-2 protease family protein [bacterium]|nr:site-2 protease family protein [bacterium]